MSALAAKSERAPSAQELFQRLSEVASDMAATCSQVEDSLSQPSDTPAPSQDMSALQDLDRMTQNLVEVSKLLERLSVAEDKLERTDIAAALETILLPSLKTYLESGDAQIERGSVDLF